MKISEMIKARQVSVSCEIFPLLAEEELDTVLAAAGRIAHLQPDFISVTYGAGGSTSKNTLRIASYLQQSYGVTALAHLRCVSSTSEEIGLMLEDFRRSGIFNILALRGDVPRDAAFPSPGHYRYACELVAQLRSRGGFCIGAACYPGGPVECKNKEEDLVYLREKVDAGCDFLTTQMFFDNNVLYSFLYRAMQKNIHVPVIAGIMPVTNSRQIARVCGITGTALPPRFRAIVDKFGDRPEAMKQAGIAYATEQIIDLVANGVRGIHLYTMNKPDVAEGILTNISHITGHRFCSEGQGEVSE